MASAKLRPNGRTRPRLLLVDQELGFTANAKTAMHVRHVTFQDSEEMAEITSGNMTIMSCPVLNEVGIQRLAGNGKKRDPQKSDDMDET
ncbi:hypothetical protein GH714_003940 [Hevea brasiliensis]|uniref:Uncharacterized protein n=1 Tax=Hevea brasiliensis TaxID=3981 RepID=A0A6A6KYP8_HEVBR|nr:hypothetical protein GH714_003940 [Hevea brasiliensis]